MYSLSKVILFAFQDAPTCPPIQDQIDPEVPFNERFITNSFQSYVSATGDYYNDSLPYGSTVKISCFYNHLCKF